MNWYNRVVANRPYIIVIIIGGLSIVTFIVSLTSSKLPDFTDPQLGFETRGTKLAQRLIAWENLNEATRPFGELTANPNYTEYVSTTGVPIIPRNNLIPTQTNKNPVVKIWGDKNQSAVSDQIIWVPDNYSQIVVSDEERAKDVSEEEELMLLSKGNGRLLDHHHHDHQHLSSDGFFCDSPNPKYSHVVLESTEPSQSLFTIDALHSACIIQSRLMNGAAMDSICETMSAGYCCRPWSLPNYITLLYNRTSCLDIIEEDVIATKLLLLSCAKFYNNLQLRPDCYESNLCSDLPSNCTKYNAVYNILYYITDTSFLPANFTKLHHSYLFLNYSMIFLPIARSASILPYYYSLSSVSLNHDIVRVSAIDFGLKNALFDDSLTRDAVLMVAGSAFMFLCMWSYTGSFFITICTILAIAMSLNISYFIYTFIFKIKFFPFMNLMAIVIAIGIGADDAFIFCKMWECAKLKKANSTIIKRLSDTLKHSVISMFVTSLTTAAALYSSFVSSITAIKCFSVFAGTAVLTNFLLMITWLPSCVVIAEKWCCSTVIPLQWRPGLHNKMRTVQELGSRISALLDRYLMQMVVLLKWLWLILFVSIAIGSAVVVFYYPKLKLPDSKYFHLLESKHLFEQYDIKFKERFWFERLEKDNRWDYSNEKLQLTFVWGVLPVDNGNYLQPNSKGSLEYDSTFDVSSPESQSWLLDFCRFLRMQPFYQSTLGPLLPNCFIESFKHWMHRRCKDAIDKIDRTPCCETSRFPYTKKVFNKCIIQAMAHLYETPADYFMPGVAGPKFSKNKKGEIKAVVVEYDSNHSYSMSHKEMNQFYSEVEVWFQRKLRDAPNGMKGGWFVSQLGFYDLQETLSRDTLVAIGVSMTAALVVMFFVTLNALISLFAIVTITCIIIVTVAILVLLDWRLNVLESVAITSAIGLAVDFSLHYGINYRLSEEDARELAVAFSLNKMAGPTFMAAITTGAAGVFMLPSSVLPYIQIGLFLVIIMAVSWVYSTVFLMALLSIWGPQKGFGEFSYKSFKDCCSSNTLSSLNRDDKTVYTAVVSESTLSTSSATGASSLQPSTSEAHEADGISRSSRRIRRSFGSRNARKKSLPMDQSPSATSGTTIVLADDLEVETRPKEDEDISSRH